VGNIDYNTLGDLQMDLLRLVRMPMWITLYWTKEVSVRKTNRKSLFFIFFIYLFFTAEHKPCKTTNVKVMLLVLLVWGYKISRTKLL
jgi:hypothetical protein